MRFLDYASIVSCYAAPLLEFMRIPLDGCWGRHVFCLDDILLTYFIEVENVGVSTYIGSHKYLRRNFALFASFNIGYITYVEFRINLTDDIDFRILIASLITVIFEDGFQNSYQSPF